jgi:hypothetical protein
LVTGVAVMNCLAVGIQTGNFKEPPLNSYAD